MTISAGFTILLRCA